MGQTKKGPGRLAGPSWHLGELVKASFRKSGQAGVLCGRRAECEVVELESVIAHAETAARAHGGEDVGLVKFAGSKSAIEVQVEPSKVVVDRKIGPHLHSIGTPGEGILDALSRSAGGAADGRDDGIFLFVEDNDLVLGHACGCRAAVGRRAHASVGIAVDEKLCAAVKPAAEHVAGSVDTAEAFAVVGAGCWWTCVLVLDQGAVEGGRAVVGHVACNTRREGRAVRFEVDCRPALGERLTRVADEEVTPKYVVVGRHAKTAVYKVAVVARELLAAGSHGIDGDVAARRCSPALIQLDSCRW